MPRNRIVVFEDYWNYYNSKPAEKWGKFQYCDVYRKDGCFCASGWLKFRCLDKDAPAHLNYDEVNFFIIEHTGFHLYEINDNFESGHGKKFQKDPAAKIRVLEAISSLILGLPYLKGR
jgi:hypothetical protein